MHADTTTAFRLGIGFAAVLVAGTLAGAAMAAPAVTTANVNLRDGPGTGYAVIATLPVNTAVAVEGCAEGWCKVDYAGASGWMAEDYLQGLTNPPVIVLPVPVVVPRPHYGHFRPPHRPPVVVPRPPHHRPPPHRPPHVGPPHRPRPPGIHPPPQRPPASRPPHHRPPATRPPPGSRPPGIHPPPQHRPPGGGRPGHGGGRPNRGGGEASPG